MLVLLPSGSVGSLKAIATGPPSPLSGVWGPPGWALPLKQFHFHWGKKHDCGLGAHGGWQVIPQRGKTFLCLMGEGVGYWSQGFARCPMWVTGGSEVP